MTPLSKRELIAEVVEKGHKVRELLVDYVCSGSEELKEKIIDFRLGDWDITCNCALSFWAQYVKFSVWGQSSDCQELKTDVQLRFDLFMESRDLFKLEDLLSLIKHQLEIPADELKESNDKFQSFFLNSLLDQLNYIINEINKIETFQGEEK